MNLYSKNLESVASHIHTFSLLELEGVAVVGAKPDHFAEVLLVVLLVLAELPELLAEILVFIMPLVGVHEAEATTVLNKAQAIPAGHIVHRLAGGLGRLHIGGERRCHQARQ